MAQGRLEPLFFPCAMLFITYNSTLSHQPKVKHHMSACLFKTLEELVLALKRFTTSLKKNKQTNQNPLHSLLLSVQFSLSVVSDSLQPHGLQHIRLPCLSPTPGVYSNSWPLSRWCHPTISSCVVPFSSHFQPFPASGSFQMSLCFASDGQSIGVSTSTSVFPMNIRDWFPLGLTGWISLQPKRLSRVLSNTTFQKHHVDVWQNQYNIVK